MLILLWYYQLFLLLRPTFFAILLILIILPFPLCPSKYIARQVQLAWPHMYPFLPRRCRYTHPVPHLPLPLYPLLLLLQIRFPPRLPFVDPVGALLKYRAPLEHGLFAFRESDCSGGFAVGFLGLFESLGTVNEGRGGLRHCCCEMWGMLQIADVNALMLHARKMNFWRSRRDGT